MSVRLSRLAILPLVLTLLVGSACGYRTTSRGRTLQGTIAIPFLQNRTAQPDIELILTNNIILALEQEGNLRVVGLNEGEYLLTGALVRYAEAPFNIDPTGKADEYRLSLFADFTFVNKETGEELWRDKRFSGNGSFYLETTAAGSTDFGDQGDVEFTRDWALTKAIEMLTQDLMNVIFGEW